MGDIQGDYVLDTLTLVCAFALSSQHKNTIKKRNKMKLATAAFLVLCTLVAIGIVSSAKLNAKPRVARGGMQDLCSGCYCSQFINGKIRPGNTHCSNGECWNNGVSVGKCIERPRGGSFHE